VHRVGDWFRSADVSKGSSSSGTRKAPEAFPAAGPTQAPDSISPFATNNEIEFIGAGPVGLWTANQMKLMDPELAIGMIEKRDAYTRPRPLTIEKDNFENCEKDQYGIISGIYQDLVKNPKMPINALETRLDDLRARLGIEKIIVSDDTDDIVRIVVRSNPNLKLLVGSDGLRGTVNEKAFGPNNVVRQELSYAAFVNYKVNGEVTRLEGRKELLAARLASKTKLIDERVRTYDQKNNSTAVNLEMMIKKDAYDKLRKKYKK
jgi:hypothetical protein